MKTRYFIGAIFGYNFVAKFAIWGTKNIHKAKTGSPIIKTATFKKSVDTRSIKSTSLI
ncbi:hypothetical protein [Bacillus nitratireducens]|uniref:hypothetical protein n=1 Tax=Bacillus nitratireducens TaxID=2026193 RepID=UPI000A27AE39|nr:hypothetical protein [Bacillus nitratireducens]OSX89896.1 hypothetical protein BTJ45_04278 [Bacillus mycoides]